MTIVICKKINDGNDIVIHSDSKVTQTYGNCLEKDLPQNQPLAGILKTVILHPQVCLSFAGITQYATDFIKEYFSGENVGWNLDLLLDKLTKIHTNSNGVVDFIICTSFQNTPEIHVIKDGVCTYNVDQAWIGNRAAFSKFQEIFHQSDILNTSEKIKSAFRDVLNSQEINDVGHFHIQTVTSKTTCPSETVFLYELKLEINLGAQNISIPAISTPVKIPLGAASNGSYGESYFRSYSPNKHGIAIHFPYGQFGILFCPQENAENGIIIKNIDGEEFAHKILNDYGIPLQGFALSNNGMKCIDHSK